LPVGKEKPPPLLIQYWVAPFELILFPRASPEANTATAGEIWEIDNARSTTVA